MVDKGRERMVGSETLISLPSMHKKITMEHIGARLKVRIPHGH